MSKDSIMLLSMVWVVWFVFITPGSLLLVLYYKFSHGLSSGKAFIKGFTGWFYIFLVLSAISIFNIVKYHPSFA